MTDENVPPLSRAPASLDKRNPPLTPMRTPVTHGRSRSRVPLHEVASPPPPPPLPLPTEPIAAVGRVPLRHPLPQQGGGGGGGGFVDPAEMERLAAQMAEAKFQRLKHDWRLEWEEWQRREEHKWAERLRQKEAYVRTTMAPASSK